MQGADARPRSEDHGAQARIFISPALSMWTLLVKAFLVTKGTTMQVRGTARGPADYERR